MSVNEYITKFTQLSRCALHEVDTDEKKQECFLNVLNDGLAYALEARDFENFQGMVNKALVLENRRCVMEHKHSWCVSISLAVAPGHVSLRLELDLCSVLLSRSFS
jgi:TPP-dependent indolepyruvate ferredoxin oxidoreductase alpha subunit